MSFEAIKGISDAEALAKAKIAEAEAKAKQMLDDAETAGKAALEAASSRAETELKELRKKADGQTAEKTAALDGEMVSGKCPKAAKTLELKNKLDSLNYAFGLLNGSQIKTYLLADDEDGKSMEEFIDNVNAGGNSLGKDCRRLIWQL